jgi:hypothetical protein
MLPNLVQPYKPVEHVAHPVILVPAAMASRQSKRPTTDVVNAAKRRRRMLNPPVQE